jgi:hypothetical protein
MDPVNLNFNNIGWEDLECDHAATLMTEFCERCRTYPPVSEQTKKPYQSMSLTKTLEHAVRKLQSLFASRNDNKPIFQEDDISKWKKMLKNDHHRNFMEGQDESDFLKSCFPVPRIHNSRNAILPTDDFPDEFRMKESKEVTMQSISISLFASGSFSQNLKLLFTYFGIGRGGEVKFLNYSRWFFCETFNMLFMQWFQRKTLKSNPSAFAPDFEYPEMSLWFMMGCYWACCDGLSRPEGIGASNSPLRRKSSYVFQDLHNIRDDIV